MRVSDCADAQHLLVSTCAAVWRLLAEPRTEVYRDLCAGVGDVWTWTAIDAGGHEVIPCCLLDTRDAGAAYHFIHDLAGASLRSRATDHG